MRGRGLRDHLPLWRQVQLRGARRIRRRSRSDGRVGFELRCLAFGPRRSRSHGSGRARGRRRGGRGWIYPLPRTGHCRLERRTAPLDVRMARSRPPMAAARSPRCLRSLDGPPPPPGLRVHAGGPVRGLRQHLGRLGRASELRRLVRLRPQLSARVSDRSRPPARLPLHDRFLRGGPRPVRPLSDRSPHRDECDARAGAAWCAVPRRDALHRRPRRLGYLRLRLLAERRAGLRVLARRPPPLGAGGARGSAARVHAEPRRRSAVAQPGARLHRASAFDPVRLQPRADPPRPPMDCAAREGRLAPVPVRRPRRGRDARLSRPRLRHRGCSGGVLGPLQPAAGMDRVLRARAGDRRTDPGVDVAAGQHEHLQRPIGRRLLRPAGMAHVYGLAAQRGMAVPR